MTDHTVNELEKMLEEAKRALSHQEYPKFVEVNESLVHRKPSVDGTPDHVSVPEFPDFHVARDGKVTVMVHSADEEKHAAGTDRPHEAISEEPHKFSEE